MNLKRNVLSWGIIFLMIFSFCTNSYFSVRAEETNHYQMTGSISYTLSNAGGYQQLNGSFNIENGRLEKVGDTITLTYKHLSLDSFHLFFRLTPNGLWQLIDFNGIDYSNHLVGSTYTNSELNFIGGKVYGQNQSTAGEPFLIIICLNQIQLSPISDVSGIANGIYSGTGSASVETAFGNFNLGNLAKTKITATISDSSLKLSFQAKNIPYEVTASHKSTDSDGISTYIYENNLESWNITVTPDGKLDGTLTYLGDRGIMNFSIQLQTN